MTNSQSAQPLPSPEEELKFFEEKENVGFGKIDMYHPVVKPVAELARMFGNAIIVRKGITDIISDGSSAYYVTQYGSAKRCSGTGDILVGVIAAYEQFARQ